MKWKLGAAKSSKLVYYYFKSIGLAPLTLENNRFHLPTLSGLLYPVAITVCCLLLTVTATALTISQMEEKRYPSMAKVWGLLRHVVCYPATVPTLTTIISSRKKIMNLMNELCDMSHKFVALGIKEDPEKFFNNVTVTITVANAIIVAMYVSAGLIEPNWQVLSSIEHGVGSWFIVNVLLIFVHVLCCIERRFKLVNERLSNLLVEPHEVGFAYNSQTSTTSGRPHEDNEAGDEGRTQHQRIIRKIEGLHSELSNLVDRTADIFAVPVLLNSFQFFCVIVLSSEFIYSIVQLSTLPGCSPEVFELLILPNIRSPLIRMAVVVFEISVVAYASAAISREGNLTRAMLNTLNDFNPASLEELEDEFFMFSIQLARKKVAVSTFGLFNLDYSYVYKIFGAVATYIIVVIQLKVEYFNYTIWTALQAHGCVAPE